MGKNLIHNYLNNLNNNQQSQTKKSDRLYFGVPSVSSTIEAFDQESDKLIKPLDGKGYLVNNDLIHMPKEFIRDTVYTTKALADGVRGKANDHQLGKMNDLGLKLSGIAIATYLMTKKSTPKTKAMEFLGFGAFLASMALWPKIALEIPARLIHGFNFRKQYIDDQGRKKFVSQDPNYIPFDLYKGDKKSENLEVIGDRLGIRRDIPNRHEAVKDQMRKISVQNNTLWMLTAGIATPIMTALACNKMEPYIGRWTEKMSNRKVNSQIDAMYNYLNNLGMTDDAREKYERRVLNIDSKNEVPSEAEKLIQRYKGKIITGENISEIADSLSTGLDVELKEAARIDIENLVGGNKFIANASTSKRLSRAIHSDILAKDAQLASKITPDKLEKAVSQGIIRGAVRDMLTSVGFMLDESAFGKVAKNFKCRDTEGLDFFAETEATKDMSSVERLAHNIKSIVMKVNNSNSKEDFVSGMSNLEISNRALKMKIDAKLQADSDEIARRFYEGQLAIGEGRESYVRTSVLELCKENDLGPKHKVLLKTIGKNITNETTKSRGYEISESVANVLTEVDKKLTKYSAVDKVLSETAHFKLEAAPETLVANNWAEVSDIFLKELNITPKQLNIASKDKAYAKRLLAERLEAVCSNEASYKKFITSLATKMAELDEKIDSSNSELEGDFLKNVKDTFKGNNKSVNNAQDSGMMSKIKSGIVTNCDNTGKALGNLGMTSMKEQLMSCPDGVYGLSVGSTKDAKLKRIQSRVDGVHSSYMRLLQSAEFFHRVSSFNAKVAEGNVASIEDLAQSFGLPKNKEMRDAIIAKGKEVLLDSHTNDFYTKFGYHNDKQMFTTLMWSLYKPNDNGVWNKSTVETMNILDEIKSPLDSTKAPRRVYEDIPRKPLGQKLREHMSYMYDNMGSIIRQTHDKTERIVVETNVSPKQQRACERFDLLAKAPTDLFHDTIKQKYNSGRWMKAFAPILAVTFGASVLAQFCFGKKDSDIKA